MSRFVSGFSGNALLAIVTLCQAHGEASGTAAMSSLLSWTRMPDLPDPLGFSGALSGNCGDKLVFAGGANFPAPTWTSTKHYDTGVWSLAEAAADQTWTWSKHQLVLPQPMGYAACGSFGEELICAGGQNLDGILNDTFAISCNPSQLRLSQFAPMPVATSMASSAVLGDQLLVVGGQTGPDLTNATRDMWILDTSSKQWRKGPPMPSSRILSLSIVHNQHVYVMSGRRQEEGEDPELLNDCWKLNISQLDASPSWDRCASLPACAMAGTIGILNNRIFVLGGDDGSHFGQDTPSNPGYTKNAYIYDSDNDAWMKAGNTTEGEVTTLAIPWKDGLVINGGEVKPRVRTNHTWFVKATDSALSLFV